ncbi:MAG: hypothetical protein KDD32_02795 [Bacteroidetes bacterium]|nr:hypothetical protein [Bacteroidota bacterium]
MLLSMPAHAQQKKKKKYKKKSDANILKRGYNDITTRNNYYFNANNIYKEMLQDIEQKTEIDYNEILPIYMHQRVENHDAYTPDLESIIKKTSEAMLLHDHTRWKDNVYLLLGKARYLNGDYRDALKTFQFIATTMKEDIGKTKNKVDNKAKYKAAKAKEAAKKAAERKKEIEKKKEEIKKQFQKLKRDKEKEREKTAKEKQKALDKRLKAKKKVIALRKKGKTPSQKLIAIAYGKVDGEENNETTDVQDENEAKKDSSSTADKTVKYKTDYRSDKKIEKEKQAALDAELAELNDTIPMTEKEAEKYNDLTFWDKIKHKKSRAEALVWMAKSFMELEEYGNAQSMLEYAEALPKLTRKQYEEIYSGEAYFYLERHRYENAVDALNNAIVVAKKKDRSKYSYIKAQIHELTNDKSNAIETYKAVAEGKTDYEMKFYANMKVAKLYQDHQIGNSDEIIEMLTKLLKNGSNKEFRDQIHYEIAAIYADRDELDKTKEHLQSSITLSRSNPLQKGLSFKALGDVYLIQENYTASALFYDSAVANVPVDYEKYDEIKSRSETISEIAKYAQIIFEQDSLLMLSKMTDQELEIYLAELERNQKIESRGRKKQKDVTSFIDEAVVVNTTNTLSNTGDWYFYNPTLISQGKNTFQKIWGDIPHENNWRRSSAQSILNVDIEEEGISQISNIDKQEEEIEVKLDIPKTDEEIAEAHNKLSNAYYEFGKLFRNNLEINGEAKQAFEIIVNKYPKFKSIDRVYYYLYLIYLDEGDMGRSAYYKSILLDNYPLSQYAVAINTTYEFDRDNEKERPELTGIEKLYVSTYSSFLDGAYEDVIQSRNEAFNRYKENPLMPKFDFLEALSYGHLDSIVVLKSKLSTIISNYPNHEVGVKAKEYLAIILQKENQENAPIDTVTIETDTGTINIESIYSDEESNNIFAFIILKDKNDDVRSIIQSLNTYNETNFAARKLRVSNAFLDKDTPLVLIKRFREKSLGIEYLQALDASMAELFGEAASANMELLMISQENFRTLFTTKKLDEYKVFFQQTFN